MKVACAALKDGFGRKQEGLRWPQYEPSVNCKEDEKEGEKGKGGGLINRVTRLKDGEKRNTNEGVRREEKEEKKNPKHRKGQNRE